MAVQNATRLAPVATPCPSRAELQALLGGDLDTRRSDELTVHVGDCPGCQGKLEAEASGEVARLPAAVRDLPRHEPPHTSALWKAIDNVVGEVTRTGTFKAAGEPPALADDDVLAFLTPTALPGRIGTLGEFEIVRRIGRGGMGVVLHAFDPDLQRDVAIKVLDPELSSNKTARQRFCREARAAAAVNHENIVTVHQVNEDERSGLPYLVMQLINGESLEQRLRRQKRLPVADAVKFGAQAAAGLAAAHAQGLIHRDVKPGNILIEAGDRVKLTDFGLARAAEDLKLTRTGYVSGTPLYMAPEQARGDEVDARADLFSLGVVLYEAVAGRPPFDGKTPLAVLREVADTPHRPLRKLAPDVPMWFEDVIDGLLAKDPADRATSAAAVAAELQAHAAAGTPCDIAASASPCPMLPGKALSNVTRRKYRRKLALIMLAPFAAGLGLGGVGALAFTPPTPVHPVPPPQVATNPPAPPAGEPALDKPVHAFAGKTGAIWALAACGDKKTLAVGSEDGTVRLFDLAKNEQRAQVNGHRGPVWAIDFHPTNEKQFVTAGDDGVVKVWNVDDVTNPEELSTGIGGVRAAAFSPDGEHLAIGQRNGKVEVLRMAKGTDGKRPVVATLELDSSLTALAFSPAAHWEDVKIAVAGSKGVVKVWDVGKVKPGQQPPVAADLTKHDGPVYAVAFSPDGNTLATGGWDDAIRLWDAKDWQERKSLPGHESGVWSLAFTGCCGHLASAGQDGTVRVWNVNDGTEEVKLRAHKSVAHVVRFTRGEEPPTLISGGRDGAVRLWKMPQ